MKGDSLRTVVAVSLMLVPSLVFLLVQPGKSGPFGDYNERARPFLLATLEILWIALVLIDSEESKGTERPGIRVFIESYVISSILGQVRTIMGALFFLLVAAILTAWFPDGVENNSWVMTLASIVYFVDVVLLFYWYMNPADGETTRGNDSPESGTDAPKPTKYLVGALSLINWSPGVLSKKPCDELITNSERDYINIVPLFVATAHHSTPDKTGKPKLSKLFLLVSNRNMEYPHREPSPRARSQWEVEEPFVDEKLKEARKDGRLKDGNGHSLSPFKKKMTLAFLKLSECLGRKLRIRWHDGTVSEVGDGTADSLLDVEMIPAGNFEEVDKVRKVLLNSLEDIIEEESNELTFDITGGTATVSSAMTLVALKGDCHAEHLRQDVYGKPPEELLKRIELNILSLEDLLDDLIKKLDRSWRKKTGNN